MTTLFVAAGGGGDAVGILLARQVLDPGSEGQALVSTCAWERLRVDPMPGPRPIEGFTGLGVVNGLAVEVLPSSDTEPPGRSVLPRLTEHPDARIFLHDFEAGARGLASQLRGLAEALSADRMLVVDVGGDVVATGQEPNLLSPLADSLTLAGAIESGIPTSLGVIGPGTDAELAESEVIHRLADLGAKVAGRVLPGDAERSAAVLAWHPTEASALVAASALGARGAVEMRRGRRPTPLTEHSCDVWMIEAPRLPDFPLADAVAGTHDLGEAVNAIERHAVNEIAYERAKAASSSSPAEMSRTARQVATAAINNGATHVTSRRLMEQMGVDHSDEQQLMRQLTTPASRVAGLWHLEALAESSTRVH